MVLCVSETRVARDSLVGIQGAIKLRPSAIRLPSDRVG